jgi:hypothetical protein
VLQVRELQGQARGGLVRYRAQGKPVKTLLFGYKGSIFTEYGVIVPWTCPPCTL